MVAVLAACSPAEPERASLRVGLLPDEQGETQRSRFQGLFSELARRSGIVMDIVPVDDYAHLLNRFADNEIDLAYFGGYTFVKAHTIHGAVPVAMRDRDLAFRSAFIVHRQEQRDALEDFQGETLAFGSDLSTSGHLMPRYFLESWDMSPESFFSATVFSGSHDTTIGMVREKQAAIGVANAEIVENYLSTHDDIRVIRHTPQYPDYVWAIRQQIPEATRRRLLDAFLSMDWLDPDDRAVLDAIGARAFLPARVEDFSRLFEIVRRHESRHE